MGFITEGENALMLKIGDFGIAVRKAQWDEGEGDGRYVAPEVLLGSADTSADIFSLGCCFYEMVAKVTLTSGGTLAQTVRQVSSVEQGMETLGLSHLLPVDKPASKPSGASTPQAPCRPLAAL